MCWQAVVLQAPTNGLCPGRGLPDGWWSHMGPSDRYCQDVRRAAPTRRWDGPQVSSTVLFAGCICSVHGLLVYSR